MLPLNLSIVFILKNDGKKTMRNNFLINGNNQRYSEERKYVEFAMDLQILLFLLSVHPKHFHIMGKIVLFFFTQFFFKRVYLLTIRERRKEGKRERNISVWLPLMRPLLGMWPATQACALTGNRTSDPLVQSTEPHQPGLFRQNVITLSGRVS